MWRWKSQKAVAELRLVTVNSVIIDPGPVSVSWSVALPAELAADPAVVDFGWLGEFCGVLVTLVDSGDVLLVLVLAGVELVDVSDEALLLGFLCGAGAGVLRAKDMMMTTDKNTISST